MSDMLFLLKQKLQRLFRPSHVSDSDIWNACYAMLDRIAPIMDAFYRSEKNGVPGVISSEYAELEDAAREWDRILNEINFSIRFHKTDSDFHTKQGKAFLKEYGYADPYAEDEKHVKTSYTYHLLDKNLYQMTFEPLEESATVVLDSSFTYYSNEELLKEMEERAKEGFALFHKYFFHLWD